MVAEEARILSRGNSSDRVDEEERAALNIRELGRIEAARHGLNDAPSPNFKNNLVEFNIWMRKKGRFKWPLYISALNLG